jgi:hypothetical protein
MQTEVTEKEVFRFPEVLENDLKIFLKTPTFTA